MPIGFFKFDVLDKLNNYKRVRTFEFMGDTVNDLGFNAWDIDAWKLWAKRGMKMCLQIEHKDLWTKLQHEEYVLVMTAYIEDDDGVPFCETTDHERLAQ